MLSWGTHKFAVQGGFNFSGLEDILKCDETYRTLRSRVGVVLKSDKSEKRLVFKLTAFSLATETQRIIQGTNLVTAVISMHRT